MKLEALDLETLSRKGKTPEALERELEMLRNGFPYLKLKSAATPGDGITVATPKIEEDSIALWDKYRLSGKKIVKMVPASGAASRMFKDIFAFVNGKKDKPDTEFMKTFFDRITEFAFFRRLNFCTLTLHGKSVLTLIDEKRYKDVAEALILSEGMNYGSLPKALLMFHKIMGSTRTPVEEHICEGALYTSDKDGNVNVHFTVSDDHLPLMQRKIEEVKALLESKYGVKLNVTMSVQKPSTDTVAVLPDQTPYRENGELFFRPGGHGALIENLNDIDADVVFLKNIDNVVPEPKIAATVRYKKILGGILVAAKSKTDRYCKLLADGKPTDEELEEMISFLRTNLCVTGDTFDTMSREEKIDYLFRKFNRPLRVAGMVRNENEPGGGPYLVYAPDGTTAPQILEPSQIDPKDKKAMKMLKNSTHFNPVDLVCAIKDYKGNKFDLTKYVDPATGFISNKSREGVEILALELPGLWNGAMSDWNTIFIEVPSETFNPVKTVLDLLRDTHRV